MPAPLDGCVVIDLSTGVAGPFCGRSLADLGARVIKVEPPGGDPARGVPPFRDGRSAAFAWLAHGKPSIVLDLSDMRDAGIFDRLLDEADVLVCDAPDGPDGQAKPAMHAAQAHRGLIVAVVSGYGQDGPDAGRPCDDAVAQARGGMMASTGPPGSGPAMAGAPVAEMAAGLYLAQGILAALADVARGGPVRRVEVAVLDALVALMSGPLAAASATGQPAQAGSVQRPGHAPSGAVEAADGLFVLSAPSDAAFERLCMVLQLPIAQDPRFADRAARARSARLLTRLIEAVTLDHPCQHWIDKLTAAGIAAAPIRTTDSVLRDPHLIARRMIVDMLDRNGRPALSVAGNPVKLSGAPDPMTRSGAPEPDANRGEILRWLDRA